MTLVEAITALLKEYHLDDFIFHVREQKYPIDEGHIGSSWDRPSVKRFEEIVRTLKNAFD